MEKIPYKSFLSSDVFKIEGPNGGTFFVHSTLIAKHSRILNSDVNGGLKETQNKMIKIEDVDCDIDDGTIMRFIEFAYTGDYTTPDEPECFKLVGESSEDTKLPAVSSVGNENELNAEILTNANEDNINPTDDTSSSGEAPMSRDEASVEAMIEEESSSPNMEAWIAGKLEFPKQGTSTNFNNQEYSRGYCYNCRRIQQVPQQIDIRETRIAKFRSKASARTIQTWSPRKPNEPGNQDYTPDLLTHAQLYVFSTRYECADLANLTLQKLRLTLSEYEPLQDVVPIIRLLTYTYTHTPDYYLGIDKLRQLVIEYAVCYLDKIAPHESLEKLLRQEGSFAADLFVQYVQES